MGDLIITYFAFGIGQTAMIDNQLVAEDELQTTRQLGSQSDLRHKIEYVLPCRQLGLNEMNIDIRLPAGGNSMQQDNIFSALP